MHKGVTKISSEIDSDHSSVSRCFSGEYESYAHYFEECKGVWTLSLEGLNFIAEWLEQQDDPEQLLCLKDYIEVKDNSIST